MRKLVGFFIIFLAFTATSCFTDLLEEAAEEVHIPKITPLDSLNIPDGFLFRSVQETNFNVFAEGFNFSLEIIARRWRLIDPTSAWLVKIARTA